MDNQYGFQNQPNGFQNQPNMNNMNNMNNMPINGKAPGYMLWLILGIVQICSLCCCNCVGFISGIITVIFAILANSDFKVRNILGYQQKINIAKIVNIVGWILMLCFTILGIITDIFSSIAEQIF